VIKFRRPPYHAGVEYYLTTFQLIVLGVIGMPSSSRSPSTVSLIREPVEDWLTDSWMWVVFFFECLPKIWGGKY
jgi:hypothetical protein